MTLISIQYNTVRKFIRRTCNQALIGGHSSVCKPCQLCSSWQDFNRCASRGLSAI